MTTRRARKTEPSVKATKRRSGKSEPPTPLSVDDEEEMAPSTRHVASASDVPVILQGVPGFFNRSIAPRSARPSVNPASPAAAQFAKVEQTVETADGEKLARPRGQRAPIGNAQGPLLGYAIDKGAAGFGRSANGLTVAASNGAAYTELGKVDDLQVSWGTWGGGTVNVGGEIVLAPALQ